MINTIVNPLSTTVNKTGGWRSFKPITDFEKCIGCGMCVRVCPDSCIVMATKKDKSKPVTDYDFCKGCGLCAAECPVKAITMEKETK